MKSNCISLSRTIIFLSTLHFVGTAAVSASELHWRNGENVCSGSWKYYPVTKCRIAEHGVESYQKCRHKDHGVESYVKKESSFCGVERYKSKTDAKICGTYEDDVCDMPNTDPTIPGKLVIGICKTKTFPSTCSHESFGVEKYKTCRHKNHGVDLYVEKASARCKIDQYKEKYNSKCPSNEISFSSNGASTEDFAGKNEDGIVPARLAQFEGLNSSCSTCDDLPVATAEDRQAKFSCLQKSITYAEDEADGFGLTSLRESVAATKELFKLTQEKDTADESSLSEDQRDFILYDLNTLYPAVRYDNPEFFPDSFSIKINFNLKSGTDLEGYTKDYGSKYRRKVHVVYGWKSINDSNEVDASDRAFEIEGTESLPEDLKPLNSYVSFGATNDIKWEIKLPNGKYRVNVGAAAGDFESGDLIIINVEGSEAMTFVPNSLVGFSTGEIEVEVSDGNLTVDGIGSKNGKISFVTIESI